MIWFLYICVVNKNHKAMQIHLCGHTEVELIGAGYSQSEILVTCYAPRNTHEYDITLEDLKVRTFTLIGEFLQMDIRRFWPGFVGSLKDLQYTFYTEKLMPKHTEGRRVTLFDGDYARAAQEGVEYHTLIDRYASTRQVSYETYLRRAIANRCMDGARGGVAGYSKDGRSRVSIDQQEADYGSAALMRLAVTTQAEDYLERYGVWKDARMARKGAAAIASLRVDDPAQYSRLLKRYYAQRSSMVPEAVEFMDYVFGVPEDLDISVSLWLRRQLTAITL